jgi:hypothetical protein
MPEKEGARDLTMDPSYRAWLESNPAPGEVFVDTGEASAADSRKLRWDPTKEQRELIKTAIDREVAIVNERYQQDAQESYAQRVGVLVDEALREAGVDPVTLQRLPDASGSPGGQKG